MNLWPETSSLARAKALFGVPPLERPCTALRTDPNVLGSVSVPLACGALPLWGGGHWLTGFVAVLVPRSARPQS